MVHDSTYSTCTCKQTLEQLVLESQRSSIRVYLGVDVISGVRLAHVSHGVHATRIRARWNHLNVSPSSGKFWTQTCIHMWA